MNSLLSALIVDDEPDVRQGLRVLLAACRTWTREEIGKQ